MKAASCALPIGLPGMRELSGPSSTPEAYVSVAVLLDQGDGDTGDALAPAERAHPLVGRGLDARRSRERRREVPLHLGAMRGEAGTLAHERRVDVHDGAREHADD